MPVTAAIALSLSAVTVLADGKIDHELSTPVELPAGAKPDEDSPTFTREYSPDNSFDVAGDASRKAEVELKKQNFFNDCKAKYNNKSDISAADKATKIAECEQAVREANSFGEEVGDIRSQQRVMAEVSRASDVAAVAAIGGAAYGQFGERDPNQADALRSAAKIQEVAGYAAYAAGATDFTMGAYAYAQQRRRLEAMQETLKKYGANPAVTSKITAAAEKTKQAAYNHMMFGAGKAAVGYASMYMAKQNRKQAESLDSYSESTITAASAAATETATSTSTGVAGGVGAPVYNNNQPYFSAASSTDATTASSSGSTTPVSSSGSSMMSKSYDASRGLASGGGVGGGGGGGFSGGAGGGGSGASATGGEPKLDAEAEEEAAKAAAGGYEMNTLGGSTHFAGGKSSGSGASEADALSGMSSLLGAAGGEHSAGTGVNPNQVYREATAEGLDSGEQSGEAGVNGGPHSLFDVVRTRYSKVVRGGLVTGPGAVEVRN